MAEPRPRARDDVVFRRVDEDWLLFDPVAQEIHVLNLTAALAWSFCDGHLTEEEIARAVAGAFESRPDAREADGGPAEPHIRQILQRFRAAGLLRGASG